MHTLNILAYHVHCELREPLKGLETNHSSGLNVVDLSSTVCVVISGGLFGHPSSPSFSQCDIALVAGMV